MNRKIRILSPTPGFAERFAGVLEASGFEAAGGGGADEVLILEVSASETGSGPCGAKEREGEKRPFLIYTEDDLDPGYLLGLKDDGLVGVIRKGMEPEEVAFLINRAVYYEKMLKRNPRAPVKIPVTVSSEHGMLKTIASQLSRDGMFIITLSPLKARSACEIEFDIPGAEKPFATAARVVYSIEVNQDLSIISNPADSFKRLVAHPGMAVYFLDLPSEERDFIEGYVETLV